MGSFNVDELNFRVLAEIDGELVDITEAFLSDDEDDEEIPFCDCDTSCEAYDQMDGYDIVDEDEFEDYLDYDPPMWGIPDVRRIVFSDPATIVFWEDGTKTVVKACEGDKFERYMGFAAACMKKMFGSTCRAKAIMEECDTENLKKWQEEAVRPKEEQKPEPKEKKDESKPIKYEDIIKAFDNFGKFVSRYCHLDEEKEEESEDGTSAE